MSSIRSQPDTEGPDCYVYVVILCLVLSCGQSAPLIPSTPNVVSVRAVLAGNRVLIQFAVSEPSESVRVVKRVPARGPDLEVLLVAEGDARTKWTLVDSSLRSGLVHEYQVTPAQTYSPWVSVDVPGSDLKVSAYDKGASVRLGWDAAPPGIDVYEVVRISDGDEVVIS